MLGAKSSFETGVEEIEGRQHRPQNQQDGRVTRRVIVLYCVGDGGGGAGKTGRSVAPG